MFLTVFPLLSFSENRTTTPSFVLLVEASCPEENIVNFPVQKKILPSVRFKVVQFATSECWQSIKKNFFAPWESPNKFLDSLLNPSTPKVAYMRIWGVF